MDGETYLAIFKENQLQRSKLVRLLEKQVMILTENDLMEMAEETKWLAIEIAEYEKKNGVVDI
ncbi:hypothetical protein DKK47_RS10905 [Enterococcus faecium]|uniref:hypothetical protein n=1 Tax=Enterococcus TaxID=1350 RepID=UPI0002A38A98|nr:MULTISPECIES: hypothetical protein [Enterococcus]HJG21682.1 hypothetical protein [Enterococcus durans]EGP5552780.1 hypothetical protein [Enterococcus faecium]EGP5569044.1 hypothetical protein [Enterococcus faecium]EGV7878252.1 hypothetical protein [Enterococcus faecium]ELB67799.1 hypothetical protein OKY_02784 [Enterococcus faecium EnGen0048]